MESQVNQMHNIILIFNEEKVDISLNSSYDYFINTICNIIQIQSEQINSLSISYIDNEGDKIILSSKEDYDIFFEQVTDNLVNSINITVKPNSFLDENECLINLINYKEKFESNNNENNNSNININNNFNNNNYINDFISNSNSNINTNLNNNNEDLNNNDNDNYNSNLNLNYNYDNFNNNNNDNEINEDKNDENINDLIFDYKCSKCNTYPIICKIFYCPQCSFYLCAECEEKGINHKHYLLRIVKKEDLIKLKEKENEEIDKKLKEKEKEENIKGVMRNYINNNNNNTNNNHIQHQRRNPLNSLGNLLYRIQGNRRLYYLPSFGYHHHNNTLYFNYGNNNPYSHPSYQPSYLNYQHYFNSFYP